MAHMSRVEQAVLLKKKAKKARQQKAAEFNKLSHEEQQEILKRRNERDLKHKTQIALWDLKHNKVLENKYPKMLETLKARKEEIYEKYEKIPAHRQLELNQINGAISVMSR